MRGVEVGEQKTDGNAFYPFDGKLPRGAAHGLFVQGHQFCAIRRDKATGHRLAMRPFDQWARLPGQILLDRIVFNPLMPGNVQNIAETVIRDQPSLCALMFQHGIRGGGGAVQDIAHLGRRYPCEGAKFRHALQHAHRRVARRCRHLMDDLLRGLHVGQHQIRKGSTDINTDRDHSTVLRTHTRCAFCLRNLSSGRSRWLQPKANCVTNVQNCPCPQREWGKF